MTKCDFAAVASVLLDNTKYGSYDNHCEFLKTLFDSFFQYWSARQEKNAENGRPVSELYLDAAKASKWLSGAARPHSELRKFYAQNPEGRAELAITLKDVIFPYLLDVDSAAQQVYDLLMQDRSINPRQREALCARRDLPEEFIADVLVFALSRKVSKQKENMSSPETDGYILDRKVPRPCRDFVGRDAELAALDTALAKSGKLFLRGIAGIGKSELALAYAQRFRSKYTNILRLTYSGSLRSDIALLNFADDRPDDSEEQRFQRHLSFLDSLQADSLLIVDNFNTTAEEEPTLADVLRLRCRVLFTTKCVFEGCRSYVLRELPEDTLLKLFCSRSGDGVPQETAREIIRTVHRHTLAVELAAKLIKRGIPAEQITKQLFHSSAKNSCARQIRTLFSLYALSEEQASVMRMMTMLPPSGINIHEFAALTEPNDPNAVNDLIETGFIHAADDVISLHPMVRDAAAAELRPSDTGCRPLMNGIMRLCLAHRGRVPDYAVICQTCLNLMTQAEHDDPQAYDTFVGIITEAMHDRAHLSLSTALNEECKKYYRARCDSDIQALIEPLAQEYSAENVLALTELITSQKYLSEDGFLAVVDMLLSFSRLCRGNGDVPTAVNVIERTEIVFNRFSACLPPELWCYHMILDMERARVMNDLGRANEGLDLLDPYKEAAARSRISILCKLEYFLTVAVLAANMGKLPQALKILDGLESLCEKQLSGDEERMTYYRDQVIGPFRRHVLDMPNGSLLLAVFPMYYAPALLSPDAVPELAFL